MANGRALLDGCRQVSAYWWSAQGDRQLTNTQLYLAIGLPILVNGIMFGLLLAYINARFDSVNQRFEAINHRFDDMRNLWLAELHRVEEVLDARLKHLEER